MTDAPVVYEVEGHICHITFNRPHVLNAMNEQMREDIGLAMERFALDDQLFVAILHGSGDRAFSVGADLKEMSTNAGVDTYGEGVAFPVPVAESVRGIASVGACPKPVIAAIDGYCLAAGFEVALQCDIRIATEVSTFGLPEPRRGLLADTGLHELCRVIPLGEALRLQLTGSPMSATRAYAIGLLQELALSRDELDEVALSVAHEICLCSPFAVQSIKRIVRGGRHLSIEDSRRLAQPYQQAAAVHGDAKEGTLAFAEKRDPRWRSA